MKPFRHWMAVLAALWLLFAVLALAKGELFWAAFNAGLSVLMLDSYRREKRSRAQVPEHRSEA